MRKPSQIPVVQRFGRRIGHLSKNFFGGVLDVLVPTPENTPPEALVEVRSVLVVRPNFRIGNTLISTPLVTALQRRFPQARIDWLSGDTTASLLSHLPLGRVWTISRRFILRPWQFVALFYRLRRERYDVAVEAGMGSFSGGLYTWLTGARHRLGCAGKGDRFLDVRVAPISVEHVYDSPVAFAHRLGVECEDHPLYIVSAEEAASAEKVLAGAGLDGRRFVAVFVGGHQDKRWPAPQWLELARRLSDIDDIAIAVFLGPEELHFAERMRDGLAGRAAVLPPQPLRIFAALWSKATLIVTPDSGPMHLAAALEVPTIAVLLSDSSWIYRPRTADDLTLLRPSVEDVADAVRARLAVLADDRGVRAPA